MIDSRAILTPSSDDPAALLFRALSSIVDALAPGAVPRELLEDARAAMRAYAGAVTRMGPCGAGQTTKLVNQMIVASPIATVAEAVSVARAAGVDAGRRPEALAGGWADSRPMQVFVPRMTAGFDAPIGALSTMLKDVDTALDLARGVDAPAPVTALVQQLLRLQVARGHADDDLATLAALYAGRT